MTWDDFVFLLKVLAALTALLGALDRLWFAKDRAGRWHRHGAPWRRFACVTREAAHTLAARLWGVHPIRPHDSNRPEDSEDRLAGGIFYTLVWLCVMFLNFAVVAQIVDIFIPSTYTVELPFVGPVGEAAVAAAPIVIVLEMVTGILVHMAWANGRWDFMSVVAKVGALLFALAWVVLEGLGSWYRGVITGGIILAGTLTTKSVAAILSAVIGSVVPVAEMYTGARAWDMFIPRFIISVFYRTQALGLWIAASWLHLVAGARLLRIHPSISDLDDDASLLTADADRTEQGIANLRVELSRHFERRDSLEASVCDLDRLSVGVDGLEQEKSRVLVLVKQLEDWLADFERSTESLSEFAAARRLEIEGLCPLHIALPEVRDSNPKLCEGLAMDSMRKLDAWINEIVDSDRGPLTRCVARAQSHIDQIEAPARGLSEFSQQLDAFGARASAERTRLEQHNERLSNCAQEAREWKSAINLASHGEALPAEPVDPLNPTPVSRESTELKLRTLREEGFLEARELNVNAEHVDGVLTRLGELGQKLSAASAAIRDLIDQAQGLLESARNLQRRCSARRAELDLDTVIERCRTCADELETKRRYLSGTSEICVRPILRNLLSQWLAHVRIRGQHATDAVILAREPLSEEQRRSPDETLKSIFDSGSEERKK